MDDYRREVNAYFDRKHAAERERGKAG